MEDRVNMERVSLKLAKQLKEAGFPQQDMNHFHDGKEYGLYGRHDNPADNKENCYGMPSLAQILDNLPAMITVEDEKYYLVIEKLPHSNSWMINYLTEGEYPQFLDNRDSEQNDKYLIAAAGKMYLCLKKEGHIV